MKQEAILIPYNLLETLLPVIVVFVALVVGYHLRKILFNRLML